MEVFAMNIINNTQDPAQDILDALRKIQDNSELKAKAATNLESVLNMLGLSGTARHAVAVGMLNGTVTTVSGRAGGFWQ
jgi:hypothetical protein